MKQKVSLASVLAGNADVVFLDEPTLGLDVESSLALQRELREIVAERDLTVVLSSHHMEVIEDVCDRVVIVRDGRVVANDTVHDLISTVESPSFRVSSPDLAGGVLEGLRRQFPVTDVTRRGRRVQVDVATDSDGFYALAAFLRSHDVRLDAVETVQPELADVFVELTRRDGR
jgi:ABC-2 type transport system ATP-binding protein